MWRADDVSEAPVGCYWIAAPVESWGTARYRITLARVTRGPRGGHRPALEVSRQGAEIDWWSGLRWWSEPVTLPPEPEKE